LQGVVSLRRLLPANPDVRVDSMMVREVVAAKPDTPQDEAARIVSKYSFNALPIVDDEHRILGIVTVDDVVDVLVAGETESMLRMGGELAKVVALSFFIPLIIGTGGNAGSQTVSTIIRALALGQIRLRDGWRVLLRETSSGFLLGALLCVFAVLRTLLWKSGPQLALVVGLTTLVDATGLAIYLLIAKVILHL
jgi:magnesium transporter